MQNALAARGGTAEGGGGGAVDVGCWVLDEGVVGEQSAGRAQQLLQQRQEQAGHEDKGRTVLLGVKPTEFYLPLPNSFSIAHGHQPRGLKATKRTAPCSSHLLRAENEAG
jgi:hypothetical protein